MYKTVRHGENSLQYTILPQTEEVLNNSGLKGKGRDYSPSIHVRRSRRRSTVKYVLMVLFGIIVALALAAVPLYVMNGPLYTRKNQQDSHEINTNSPLTPTGREMLKSRKKELKITVDSLLAKETKPDTSTTITSSTTTTTVATTNPSDSPTTPPWTMPALRSWKSTTSSTTIQPIPTEDNEKIPPIETPPESIDMFYYIITDKPPVQSESITIRNVFQHYSRIPYLQPEIPVKLYKNVLDDVLITTKATTTPRPITTDLSSTENTKFKDLKDTLLSVDDDDEFKESLEVDEVFSLPPLKPDSAAPSDSGEVTVSKAGDGTWYGARWPFVDTSSYFQWTVSVYNRLANIWNDCNVIYLPTDTWRWKLRDYCELRNMD